jgi:mono/diheme cytochrome c family protein
VKILLPIIAACFSFSALTAVSAQNIPPGQDLTANPVFQKNCAKCHGKTAGGRHFGGPSLVSEKATSMPLEDLRNFITNGKGRMPKFSGKLTEAEIDTLVRQIKAGNGK